MVSVCGGGLWVGLLFSILVCGWGWRGREAVLVVWWWMGRCNEWLMERKEENEEEEKEEKERERRMGDEMERGDEIWF